MTTFQFKLFILQNPFIISRLSYSIPNVCSNKNYKVKLLFKVKLQVRFSCRCLFHEKYVCHVCCPGACFYISLHANLLLSTRVVNQPVSEKICRRFGFFEDLSTAKLDFISLSLKFCCQLELLSPFCHHLCFRMTQR